MKSDTSPSRQLTQWIDEQIRSREPGYLFPPDTALAERFGVSVSTVRRAMEPFRAGGLICRRSGKGTFIPVAHSMPADEPVRGINSVESIAQLLQCRIAEGRLRKGRRTPSVKLLSLEWHVAPSTVTAALRLMCARGYMTKVGRTYIAGGEAAIAPEGLKKQVVAFHSARAPFSYLYGSHPFAHAYRSFEYELIQNGYELVYAPIEEFPRLCGRWKTVMRYPHGLFFTFLVQAEYSTIRDTLHALQREAREMRPRALLMGKLHPEKAPAVDCFDFGHANTNLFRTLAAYLAERKFSRICICTPDRAQAGYTFSPQALVKLWTEVNNITSVCALRFNVITDLPGADALRVVRERLPATTEEHLRAVLSKYRPVDLAEFARDVRPRGSLESALADMQSGDIWIFTEDGQAQKARDYLEHSRSFDSRDIMVMSLENNPGYFLEGISVCTFDFDTIGYLLAHALIGDIPVAKSHKGFIHAPALVLERKKVMSQIGS